LYSTASWIPVVLYFVASKCGVDSSDWATDWTIGESPWKARDFPLLHSV
jgi:hypothetical protein